MEVLILLAVLACPIVMGTMMLLMRRGMRAHGQQRADDAAAEQRVVGEREEVPRG